MSKRISRRIFLGGAALLGAGIALDRVGRGEQVTIVEESDAGALTPTVVAHQAEKSTTTVLPTIASTDTRSDVVMVAAGHSHSLIVTRSGEVVAWGNNEYGQTDVPAGLQNVIQVAGGYSHSLAVLSNGKVVAWGLNDAGQCNVPTDLRKAVAVAASWYGSIAVLEDGEIIAWGIKVFAQTEIPSNLQDVVAISAGANHLLVATVNGEVGAWGSFAKGEINIPNNLRNVIAVAAGNMYSLAVTQNGDVVAWGNNHYGETNVPDGVRDIVQVAAGSTHSLALTRSGEVIAWGNNNDGQTNIPNGLRDVVAIAAGGYHSLALTQSGKVVAWGANDIGQCNVPSEFSATILHNQTTQQRPNVTQGSDELAKITAVMWSNSPVLDENFKKRADLFNAKYAGKYEVSMELLPRDQYWPKVDLAYASNEPIDVYFWDVQAYGHYKQGLVKNVQADLDAVADFANPDLYPQEQMAVWKFDGANMYAVPENFQSMALFYNKDLFDAAGVAYPDANTTWDDILVMAEKLKKVEGEEVTLWGFDVGDLAVWWGSISLAWAQGGGYFDKVVEPTKFTFSSPEAQKALKWIQDIMYVSKLAPDIETRSVVGRESGMFGSGLAAIFPGGTWMISSYQNLPFNWDMALMPKWGENRAMPYWFGGWVIPKNGKHTDAATAWAIWCATEYQQTMAKTRDWIPIRADARNSAAFLDGMPAGFKDVSAAISSARIGDVYSAKVQKILGEVISPTLDLVWNNKISVADAGKEIDEKANAMLAEQ